MLAKFIEGVEQRQGFISSEIQKDDERVGFEIVSHEGKSTILASVDSKSSIRVSRYGVEVDRLSKFCKSMPPIKPHDVLYIDEIGQMQLYSAEFQDFAKSYLAALNLYVGTISAVYDHPFIREVKSRKDVVMLNITPENRDAITQALIGLQKNIQMYNRLSAEQSKRLKGLAAEYAKNATHTQLYKLFNNAIPYVAEGRIKLVKRGKYHVRGNTEDHSVERVGDSWQCDCPLFKGEGKFKDNAGECSHIQAVKILG